MDLKAVYDTKDDIPEKVDDFRALFTEKNGKFELTGMAGVKTEADVARVQTSLTKERADHKATKDKLGVWGELEHADVVAKLDRIGELEAAAGDKLDEAKIDELATKRADAMVATKLAPLQRENRELTTKNEELTEANTKHEGANRTRKIHDVVAKAAGPEGAKVLPSAIPDVLLLADQVFQLTEDGAVLTKDELPGVTAGLDPAGWLTEIQPKREHWWGATVGGGARGSGGGGGAGGTNPFTAENWDLTEQGKVVTTHGIERANQLAKAAGTTVGGMKPAAKK